MNKRFKPQDGQLIYIVDSDLSISEFMYDEIDEMHQAFVNYGNCFESHQDAWNVAEQIRVRIDLQRLADIANDTDFGTFGCDPTVWDTFNNHYYIYWDCVNECLDVLLEWDQRADLIYFPSVEAAQDAIKQLGAERIAQYYLGVDPDELAPKEGDADA